MFNDAANESDPPVHAVSKHRSLTLDKRPHTHVTPKDAIQEVGPNALELQTFNPSHQGGPSSLPDRIQREKRRAEQYRWKLSRIVEREAMKFSHSIQFNAVPDWSSHYISYSNLKKLYGHQGILPRLVASGENLHQTCQLTD
jgi:hypothetical protein